MSGLGVPTCSTAQEYHDITDLYLHNYGFDTDFDYPVSATGNVAQEIREVNGWAKDIDVNYTITGVYQYGTKVTFNGAPVPEAGYDGSAAGGCLALSTGWTQSMLYFQNVTLPAGRYGLVSAFYSCGDKSVGESRVGWIPAVGSEKMSSVSDFPCGEWTADTVWFDVAAPTAGKIQIGYKSGAGGSANSAKVALDFVKLIRDTPAGKADVDIYKDKLAPIITKAETLYADGSGNGAAALKEAIDDARRVAADDAATIAQVEAAIASLEAAIDTYLWANPTGDVPTVTTDSRYARGATVAFGRMSVTGTYFTELGFCWSETPEPTIKDNTTTEYLENNGRIYKLSGLKPATQYYMRAYAVTPGRQVGYGETVRFYTIPKGQIAYTIRSGGDAATVKRITDAVKEAVDYWNNLTEMKGFSTSVGYEDGVPTADCSYGGWIRVGSNTAYQATGTILHELLHGVGVIPWADTEWSRHNLRASVNGDGYGTGQWLGDRVTELLRFWDNSTTAQLNGDYQHMWPYGINGAHEDTHSEVLYTGNGLVCQALGEDGLQHTGSTFAQPYYSFNHEEGTKYYIKNESAERGLYSSYLIVTPEGKLTWRAMSAADAAANDSTAWTVTFTPENQYYQLRNAATGRYLTYAAAGTNGIRTAARTAPAAADNFQLMRGRTDVALGTQKTGLRGYWLIHPESNWTPRCLQAAAGGVTTAVAFDIANKADKQRWLILTQEEMAAVEQGAFSGMKVEIGKALDCLKTLVAVPHTEDTEGTDDAAAQLIKRVEQTVEQATGTADIMQLEAEIRAGIGTFLRGATPSSAAQPFDLTYMLVNPDMESAEGWSAAPTINHSCGEFYQATFDMNQTLSDMPAGTYQLRAKAFQRPGTSTASYSDYAAGTDRVTAYLYAGSAREKLTHIAACAQSTKLGGAESSVGSGLYMPNDMQAASIYFGKGLYENIVTATLDSDGSNMKVGISSSSMPSYYWCIFDDFRLYFFGSMPLETVTAIETVSAAAATRPSANIYSIDGRIVRKAGEGTAGLPKGIYIIGGKKVVI